MAKRRGKGEGTISQRADGRWQARVDLGRGPDGRRLRKVAYGATRQAAAKSLNKLLGRASTGELLTTSTPTVKTWLADWHRTHRSAWRPGTRRVYQYAIDEWIVPELGHLRLEQLKPITIQRWVNRATEGGARTKVVLARVVLHAALQWAMTQRMVTFNPAALVTVPRPVRKPITPLSAVQGQRLIETAQDHPLGGMVILSLTMGLRIGEVSGLTWGDVDQVAGTLKLRQQVQALGKRLLTLAPLKTAHSRRTLALPALAADALKGRRKAQLEERMKAGDQWKAYGDLVFTSATGQLLHPSTVRSLFERLLKAADLPHVKFHALRHTAATLLLASGTPLFDVSRILGHASIDITADIYGHLVEDMTARAATRMDGIFKAVGVS